MRARARLQKPYNLLAFVHTIFSRRQMAQLALDVLFGVRPDALRMREVRAQHDLVLANHMSNVPELNYSMPPDLGQHNREVFGGLLGLSDAEIANLMEQKVIY
jgi:hypothetical protein